MVKRKFDKNQAKLGIKTLDWNVPKDHISRFVVEFIEEVFPLLEIKEPKKKKGRDSLPVDSMLKLLIYAKIQHIDSTSIIADMARYHDIFNIAVRTVRRRCSFRTERLIFACGICKENQSHKDSHSQDLQLQAGCIVGT